MSTSISTDRKRMSVDLLTPEGSVFSGQAWMVVAPSVSGELGILPRHQPIVAALRPGETRLKMLDDSQLVLATTTGYMSVEEDRVLILVEQAERADEIDQNRARAALQRAQDALAEAGDDESARNLAQAALRRAENRLRVSDKQH